MSRWRRYFVVSPVSFVSGGVEPMTGVRLVLSNDIGDDAPGVQVRAWLHHNQVRATAETVPGLPTPQIVIVADDQGTRTWFPQLPGVAASGTSTARAPAARTSRPWLGSSPGW